MRKLIILDYNKGGVHTYVVEDGLEIDGSYIKALGFNEDECSWMIGTDIDFLEHQDIITKDNKS